MSYRLLSSHKVTMLLIRTKSSDPFYRVFKARVVSLGVKYSQ